MSDSPEFQEGYEQYHAALKSMPPPMRMPMILEMMQRLMNDLGDGLSLVVMFGIDGNVASVAGLGKDGDSIDLIEYCRQAIALADGSNPTSVEAQTTDPIEIFEMCKKKIEENERKN